MTSATDSIAGRSGRGVLAVLGPTNTGKTHLAIDRMVAHETGIIGLPLRLLAREVYGRVAQKVGTANVALITGEEKINADGKARFQVCTVEAMPETTDAAFVAIDEVQLAADLERGHIFTDRLLNLRGRHETMLLGAETVQRLLQDLLPGINVITRPRMSVLTFAGQKKITRLPRRSAVVAFSADEVYAIGELIRRQRGGAAIVLGSLSPRTRNAQVELYQSGDVDFLVATDAIGMGLNLDLDHVAFAQDRKFDGFAHRRLNPAEMGQIAGRAGRHTRDGTFGITGQVAPFDDALVQRLETHDFEPVKVLVWRNSRLDFGSVETLKQSLDCPSDNRMLIKSFPSADRVALDNLTRDSTVHDACGSPEAVRLLWEICGIPDYRRISPAEHAELLGAVFMDMRNRGKIDEDWFAQQVARTDRTDGDIDALSARIAHIRTWTYLSNRPDWLADPHHWQARTREIEDRLSDALHENLTKRFIDRRTSVLMKRLRENAMLDAEIRTGGEIIVEGHLVGHLQGFRFKPDSGSLGQDAKAANAAAARVLADEIGKRAERLRAAPNSDIVLDSDATVRWIGEPVARLVATDEVLKPRLVLLADEQLTGPHRDMVANRIERWVGNHIATQLGPIVQLGADPSLTGMARGVAFRIIENLGVIERQHVASEVQSLDQDMRAGLRKHGVRFGAYHIFVPALLKPAPVSLICLLWALKNDRLDAPGLAEIPAYSAAGRTSFAVTENFDPDIYRICGFRLLGTKAVRIDILERLADLIRPALFWRRSESGTPPDGAIDGHAFYVTPPMLSILGATREDMENVLKGLGYRGETMSEEAFASLRASLMPKPADVPETPASTGPDDNSAGEAAASAPDPSQADALAAPDDTADTEIPETLPASAAAATEPAPAEPAGVAAAGTETEPAPAEPAGMAAEETATEPAPAEPAGMAAAETATEPTPADTPPDGDAADEPKTVTIWRPSRQRRHAGEGSAHRKRQDQSGDEARRKAGQAKKHARFKGRKSAAPKAEKPAARPVDPDSPFAKLMQLKADLEKGK